MEYRINDQFVDTVTTVKIQDIIPPNESESVKESKAFSDLLKAMDEHLEENLLIVSPYFSGNIDSSPKYKLIDGFYRYLIYRDYIFEDDLNVVVLNNTVSGDEALDELRECYRYHDDGIRSSFKQLRSIKKFVAHYALLDNFIEEASRMTGMAESSIYRIQKCDSRLIPELKDLCLKYNASLRSVEVMSSLDIELQKSLSDVWASNPKADITETTIRQIIADIKIGEESKELSAPILETVDNTKQKSKIQVLANKATREKKRAEKAIAEGARNKEIIRNAILYDQKQGVQIKDIKNLPSKVTISSHLIKCEEAIAVLEKWIYKKKYNLNHVEILRIRTMIGRLDELLKSIDE